MKVHLQNVSFSARFNVDSAVIKKYPQFLDTITEVAEMVGESKSRKVANLTHVKAGITKPPGSPKANYSEHLRITKPNFWGKGEKLISEVFDFKIEPGIREFKNWLIDSLHNAGVLIRKK